MCQDCFDKINLINDPVCERCGISLPLHSGSKICQQCQQEPLQVIDGIRAAAYFEDNSLRPAIHRFKYRNHKALASILAEILTDAYRRYNLNVDVIVPVPLHISRLRQRGYNQSELLAIQVGHSLGLPINTGTLYRVRKTKSQMELGADERRQNVDNAFACQDQTLSGQTVLLLDDVCTTGSTLEACAAALKQSGVRAVWGLALARAH